MLDVTTIPMEQFPLRWRLTDPKYRVLATAHLRVASSVLRSVLRAQQPREVGSQATTSSCLAKCSSGGAGGSVMPNWCVIVLTVVSHAAGCSGQGEWWISPRDSRPAGEAA